MKHIGRVATRLLSVMGAYFAVGMPVAFVSDLLSNPASWSKCVQVEADGRLLVRTDTYVPPNPPVVRDLDGRLIDEKKMALAPTAYLEPLDTAAPMQPPKRRGRYRRLDSYDPGPARDHLVYLVLSAEPDLRTYGVVYDQESRHRVGYLGKKGLSATIPSLEERLLIQSGATRRGYRHLEVASLPSLLDAESGSTSVILCRDGTWEIDFSSLTAQRQVVIEGCEDISAFSRAGYRDRGGYSPPPPAGDSVRRLALLHDGFVTIVDGRLTQLTTPVPTGIDRARGFTVYSLKDGGLIYCQSVVEYGPENPDRFIRCNANGAVIDRREIVLDDGRSYDEMPAWIGAGGFIVELALLNGVADARRAYREGLATEAHVREAAADARKALPFLLPCILLGSLVILRLQRKYHRSDTLSALGLAILFGVPGVVVYLVSRKRSPLGTCPGCARRVPLDRPECAACGADFPPPQATRHEIFG